MKKIIEQLYEFANDYLDETEGVEFLIKTIGGYGSQNSSLESINENRGKRGSYQGLFADIYDFMVADLPNKAREAIDLLSKEDLEYSPKLSDWRDKILAKLDRLISTVIPNLKKNLEEGGVRATRQDFSVGAQCIISLVGFLNYWEDNPAE